MNGKRCIICGHETVVEDHHVVPNSLDKEHDETIPLCPSCHALVHRYVLKGLMVWLRDTYHIDADVEMDRERQHEKSLDDAYLASKRPSYSSSNEAKFLCLKCGTVIRKEYNDEKGSVIPPDSCYQVQGGCGRENMATTDQQEEKHMDAADATYFVLLGDVSDLVWEGDLSGLHLDDPIDSTITERLVGTSPAQQSRQHWIMDYIQSEGGKVYRDNILYAAREEAYHPDHIRHDLDELLEKGHLYQPQENIYAEA